MKPVISILLVDDHALVREALRDQLNGEADLSVVGTAANANDARVPRAACPPVCRVRQDLRVPVSSG